MLEIEEFRRYLQKIGFGAIPSYISYINNLMPILEKIEDYNNLSDIDKIKRFSKEDNDFKTEFNKFHDYKSPTTFSDFRSASKKYIKFLKNIENGKELIISEEKVKISMKTKNIMLYGAPGVGKTHNYKRLITMIENGESEKTIFDSISKNETTNDFDNSIFETIKNEKRIEFVTFHQSYSYEDFIEGFRPQDNGNIKLEDGIFKILCEEAKNSSKNFYIVIDEINRGNISKIFGELITLIEEDKRDDYEVTLPYSKEKFKIPSNLYIIATMNSTDKSIATIDIALRRRFTFLKMKPKEELVKNVQANKLMKELNNHIKETISEDYQLGHSYFMNIKDDNDLEFVKEYKIKPLLEEYFYGDTENYKKALKILGFDDEPNKQ